MDKAEAYSKWKLKRDTETDNAILFAHEVWSAACEWMESQQAEAETGSYDNDRYPSEIYLMESGEGLVWCNDPAPGIGMDPEDSVKYLRSDTAPQPAQEGEQ